MIKYILGIPVFALSAFLLFNPFSTGENPNKNITQYNNTSTATINNNANTNNNNNNKNNANNNNNTNGYKIDIKLFNDYLKDIEQQTNRTISIEQRNLLVNWISNNSIKNLDKEITEQRRKEFNKKKKQLLSEWSKHYNEPWSTYKINVLSAKTGKVLRHVYDNYDAHHIIELDYGGENEWWNMHPAAYPDAHQNGIHRKDSVSNKIFK